jgi:hypothetical protein
MPGPGRVWFREIPLIYRWMDEWRNFSDVGDQVISLDVATAYHTSGRTDWTDSSHAETECASCGWTSGQGK